MENSETPYWSCLYLALVAYTQDPQDTNGDSLFHSYTIFTTFFAKFYSTAWQEDKLPNDFGRTVNVSFLHATQCLIQMHQSLLLHKNAGLKVDTAEFPEVDVGRNEDFQILGYSIHSTPFILTLEAVKH